VGANAFKKKVLIQTLIDTYGWEKVYDFGHCLIPLLIHSIPIYVYDFCDEAGGRRSQPAAAFMTSGKDALTAELRHRRLTRKFTKNKHGHPIKAPKSVR
jgi:hypothetical protein